MMNKKIYSFLAACGLLFMFTGCNGLFDGIYDEAPADADIAQEFTIDEKNPTHFQLSLDARSYSEWIYINLHTKQIETRNIPTSLSGQWDGKSGTTYNLVEGTKYTCLSSVKTDAQENPDAWDIAIHHFDVRTNGGSAYETKYGNVSQLPASSSSFADATFTPDEWTTNQVIVDLTEMMGYKIGYQNGYVNKVLTGWVTMDFSTPPPVYTVSGRAYVIRFSDGTCAAMSLDNYVSAAGTKGFLTIDFIYPY